MSHASTDSIVVCYARKGNEFPPASLQLYREMRHRVSFIIFLAVFRLFFFYLQNDQALFSSLHFAVSLVSQRNEWVLRTKRDRLSIDSPLLLSTVHCTGMGHFTSSTYRLILLRRLSTNCFTTSSRALLWKKYYWKNALKNTKRLKNKSQV